MGFFEPVIQQGAQWGVDQALAGLSILGPGLELIGSDRDSDLAKKVLTAAGRSIESLSLAATLGYHTGSTLGWPAGVAAAATVIATPFITMIIREKTQQQWARSGIAALETMLTIAAKVSQIIVGSAVLGGMLAEATMTPVGVASVLVSIALAGWVFAPEAQKLASFLRFRFSQEREVWSAAEKTWMDVNGLLRIPDQSWAKSKELLLGAVQDLATSGGRKHRHLSSKITRVIRGLTPVQIDDCMQGLFEDVVRKKDLRPIECFLDQLSLDQVKALVQQVRGARITDAKNLATELSRFMLKPYQTMLDRTTEKEIHRLKPQLGAFFSHVVQIFEAAFGVNDLGRAPENAVEAASQWDHLKELIMFPIALITFLVPAVQPNLATWSLAVAGALLVLGLIGVFYRYVRPCPDHVRHCENMVLKAAQKKYSPVYNRRPYIDSLIDRLSHRQSNIPKHPLLVGKEGVGKTEIVRGLAQRIAQGDVPASLRNTKIFHIDMSRFCRESISNWAETFEKEVLGPLRGHEGRVILFLNHLDKLAHGSDALSERARACLATLSRHLDMGADRQIRVIAATTAEGYQTLSQDPRFMAALERVNVEEISDADTREILRNRARTTAPQVWCAAGVFDKIISSVRRTRSSKAILRRAQDLLDSALKRIVNSQSQPSALTELIDELNSERMTFVSSGARIDSVEGQAFSRRAAELEEEIDAVRNRLRHQRDLLDGIDRLQRYQMEWEGRTYYATRRLSLGIRTSAEDIQRFTKEMLLGYYYVRPLFARTGEKVSTSTDFLSPDFSAMGYEVRLDNTVIDTVLNDRADLTASTVS